MTEEEHVQRDKLLSEKIEKRSPKIDNGEFVSLTRTLKNSMFRMLYDCDEELAAILGRMDAFFPIENLKSEYLTSGQRQLLALILGIRKAPANCLILIDEPEISLHVDWQVQLIENLIIPLNTSRILLTTHSPDIALNHPNLCDFLRDDGDFQGE